MAESRKFIVYLENKVAEQKAEIDRLGKALDVAIEGIKVGWQMDTDLGDVGYNRAEHCLGKIKAALDMSPNGQADDLPEGIKDAAATLRSLADNYQEISGSKEPPTRSCDTCRFSQNCTPIFGRSRR